MRVVTPDKIDGEKFKTLYIFDSLGEAIEVAWAIMDRVTHPKDHVYLIKNVEVLDDIGLGVYEMKDRNNKRLNFMYSPNGLSSIYRTPEEDIEAGEIVSIIGLIEDLDSCIMRGLRIQKNIEEIDE